MKHIINIVNNKTVKLSLVLIILPLIASCKSLAYVESNFNILSDSFRKTNDSLVIKLEKLEYAKVIISFENKSIDTLYLFSSYFKQDKYFNSKYLNRINYKTQQKKLSFLPLVRYLSMNLSDRIILGENSVIRYSQVKYEFIELAPNSREEITFFINDTINLFTKDIEDRENNTFNDIKWLEIENQAMFNKYNNVIEFAVYKKIEKILNHDLKFAAPKFYNYSVKDFETYSVMLKR